MPEVRFKDGLEVDDETRAMFVAMFDSTESTKADTAFFRWERANPSAIDVVAMHGLKLAGSLALSHVYSRDDLRSMAMLAMRDWLTSRRQTTETIEIRTNPTGYMVTVGKGELGRMLRKEYPESDKAALRHQRITAAESELTQLLGGTTPSLEDVVGYSQAVSSARRGMRPLLDPKPLLVRASDVTGDRRAAARIRRNIREDVLATVAAEKRVTAVATAQGRLDTVVTYNRNLFVKALERAGSDLAQAYADGGQGGNLRLHVEAVLAEVVQSGMLARPSDLLPDSADFDWDQESDELRARAETGRGAPFGSGATSYRPEFVWCAPTEAERDVHKFVHETILARGRAALDDKDEWITQADYRLKADSPADDTDRWTDDSTGATLVDPAEKRFMLEALMDSVAAQVKEPRMRVVISEVLIAYADETPDDKNDRYDMKDLVDLGADEESGGEQAHGSDIDYAKASRRARENRRGLFKPKNKRRLHKAFTEAGLKMPDDETLAHLIRRAVGIVAAAARCVDEYE